MFRFVRSGSNIITLKRVAKFFSQEGSSGIYQTILPALSKFEKAGLEYFYVCSDNNILGRVPDLHMVGCAICKTADCVVKVIEKKMSSEEIGNLKVLDSSKISKQVAEKSHPNNSLKFIFREGKACLQYDSLPYHEIQKSIPFWNPNTRKIIHPIGKNGIKKERFIYDALVHANNFMMWKVSSTSDFSPLKNSEGVDCLSKCVLDFNSFAGDDIREMHYFFYFFTSTAIKDLIVYLLSRVIQLLPLLDKNSNINKKFQQPRIDHRESNEKLEKHFGKGVSKCLGIAATIMSKMGYREGFGLGAMDFKIE
uniref:UDP-N-acetylglucosamine diphosphorylase n=1 Tax=Meloidogyne floridensis TaxID=298350 RepID=A0A915NTC9_9BILA